ncbi:hypothetical protein FHS18_000583 [Paenibacillus phyllosphaerae]|uniref:HPr kinase/phosphorylase C-terminal domain-containing protein n=1 Tax=Paenibacillus phyllosphaerae TaxID=274593 RepID=A0A7W5ATM1_9BACL|nr:aldolase [Paenibacillus phyllosphaerae]MBB3108555.1 hypothetical protein [Paenibacillus phyllosphaerae]
MTESYIYEAFGLQIRSQVAMPELVLTMDPSKPVDVDILLTDLNPEWQKYGVTTNDFVVDGNKLYFCIEDTALYCIEDGTHIKISTLEGYDEDKLRLFTLGTSMGVLLLQRNVLPLHGSAIEIDGKAYLIVGESGAGKSTLAAALISRGYRILSDDVIPVTINEETQEVLITPSYPQQKLWQESLDRLGMNDQQYQPLYQELTKFAIPVTEHYHRESVPLGGIFELNKTEGDQLELLTIEGLQKLPVFQFHTYRNFLIPLMRKMDWHFQLTAQIASQIEMFRIRRPESVFTVEQLVDFVLSKANKGAGVA